MTKVYRIRSGNKWYHHNRPFDDNENASPIYLSRKGVEARIQDMLKCAIPQKNSTWGHEYYMVWMNAEIVEYELVRCGP